MPPLRPYVKYSLLIHLFLVAVLAASTYFVREKEPERMRFVVMAKGTSPNAVLTRDTLAEMGLPETDARITKPPPARQSPTPSKPTPPTETPGPTPRMPPTPAPTPHPKPTATPKPDPTAKASPSPVPTAAPKPKASPSPSPRAEAEPTKKPATPTPKPTAKPPEEKKAEKAAKPTPPKETPTPTPKVIASAYEQDEEEEEDARRSNMPRQTPAGAEVQDKVPDGKVAGVPGAPEGVEGAPLSLADQQSPLPPVYSNRAIMLLTRYFRVPPEMNEPDMVCVVEWDILPNGTFDNISVVKSTGNPATDKLATDAVAAVAQLDPLPAQFRNRPLRVSYPFVYGF